MHPLWTLVKAVHPRSRGEHTRGCFNAYTLSGSSPLARGTQIQRTAERICNRFIPARAGNTSSRSCGVGGCSVHPRSRGEHTRGCFNAYTLPGSSPLARGTPVPAAATTVQHRFIPARAGNTGSTIVSRRSTTVHPRSRGEHIEMSSPAARFFGSSPLARGTHQRMFQCAYPTRFIPARAGNTASIAVCSAFVSVHPRSRGEHNRRSTLDTRLPGSSPLARGILPGNPGCASNLRFIPARAGNTIGSSPCGTHIPVHPRSRGEHTRALIASSFAAGSSPLARGTPLSCSACPPTLRFIPARAGNTGRCRVRLRHAPVHPRSRGEHNRPGIPPATRLGSSPLARGTLQTDISCRAYARFIPARAGNTSSACSWAMRPAVHPRSRGEHINGSGYLDINAGSSPLARGTPSAPLLSPAEQRFIPARAGNT